MNTQPAARTTFSVQTIPAQPQGRVPNPANDNAARKHSPVKEPPIPLTPSQAQESLAISEMLAALMPEPVDVYDRYTTAPASPTYPAPRATGKPSGGPQSS